MTEVWAKLWYQCLHGSGEYGFYHAARYKGNVEECAAIEARNGSIKEVYEDFGHTYFWPLMKPGRWEELFAERRHLFMPSVRIVDDLTDYQSQQGHLLLEVPLQPGAKSTAALVHHLLARQYDSGACAQHWWRHAYATEQSQLLSHRVSYAAFAAGRLDR